MGGILPSKKGLNGDVLLHGYLGSDGSIVGCKTAPESATRQEGVEDHLTGLHAGSSGRRPLGRRGILGRDPDFHNFAPHVGCGIQRLHGCVVEEPSLEMGFQPLRCASHGSVEITLLLLDLTGALRQLPAPSPEALCALPGVGAGIKLHFKDLSPLHCRPAVGGIYGNTGFHLKHIHHPGDCQGCSGVKAPNAPLELGRPGYRCEEHVRNAKVDSETGLSRNLVRKVDTVGGPPKEGVILGILHWRIVGNGKRGGIFRQLPVANGPARPFVGHSVVHGRTLFDTHTPALGRRSS